MLECLHVLAECVLVMQYREVVQRVRAWYPDSILFAAGWSLGGQHLSLPLLQAEMLCLLHGHWDITDFQASTVANILVHYLAEEGHKTPLTAAASLCNPFDLVSSQMPFHLPHGWPHCICTPAISQALFLAERERERDKEKGTS